MTHSVDVLMPAYNAGTTIEIAVESILNQTVRDLRVHIVNDGSTDDTGDVLARLAVKDPRVHVYTQPNEGIVDSLNNGLEHCRAEFLARIDADDIAYPERIETQIAYLRANPDVVAVGAKMRHVDINGVPLGSIAEIHSPDLADPSYVPCIEPYLIHPVMTARRTAIEAAGRYRQVYYAEDTDLYWRLRDHGRLYNMPELLGDYRFHAGSVSGQSIVNGRIMSVSSQLTGLSTLRRARGVPDLIFRKDSLAAYRKARTLSAMVEIGAVQLDVEERRHFEEAVAGKIMELTAYRPYELETEDCAYVGMIARRGFGHLPPENARVQQRRISGTASRIAAKGRMRDALLMLPPAMLPMFLARTAARVGLPDRVWRALRRGGSATVFK